MRATTTDSIVCLFGFKYPTLTDLICHFFFRILESLREVVGKVMVPEITLVEAKTGATVGVGAGTTASVGTDAVVSA